MNFTLRYIHCKYGYIFVECAICNHGNEMVVRPCGHMVNIHCFVYSVENNVSSSTRLHS